MLLAGISGELLIHKSEKSMRPQKVAVRTATGRREL